MSEQIDGEKLENGMEKVKRNKNTEAQNCALFKRSRKIRLKFHHHFWDVEVEVSDFAIFL